MDEKIILAVVLVAIAGSIVYLESLKGQASPVESAIVENETSLGQPVKTKPFPRAQELQGIHGFINTDNITVGELVGKKVVLVDFWTYSCINCQRTIPYLNEWHAKYKDAGLEIVGVHTPEFEFEKNYDNVKKAVEKFGIEYPVVLDNDYATWKAYKNRYWPRKYLIDIDGYIVYDHIGEGGYEETEAKIQELLKERMRALGMNLSVSTGISQPENKTDVDFSKVESPETYFGALRNENLANGIPFVRGVQTLYAPSPVERNSLYLVGAWNFTDEYAENLQAQAKIIFKYKAKNVYLVASSLETIDLNVTLDGKPLRAVSVKEDALYEIVKASDYGEHTLEITISSKRLKAFAFTFG